MKPQTRPGVEPGDAALPSPQVSRRADSQSAPDERADSIRSACFGMPAFVGVQGMLAVASLAAAAGGTAVGARPAPPDDGPGDQPDAPSPDGDPSPPASGAIDRSPGEMPATEAAQEDLAPPAASSAALSDEATSREPDPANDPSAGTADPAAGSAAPPTEASPSKERSRERGLAERAERLRERQRAAEEIAHLIGDDEKEAGDRGGAWLPLVRHMAFLTKELAEAQRTAGRVSAERDSLRQELAQFRAHPSMTTLPVAGVLAEGSDVSDAADQSSKDERIEARNGVRAAKQAERLAAISPDVRIEARLEARAAKQAERLAAVSPASVDPELAQQLAERAAELGKRRRMILVAVMAGIATTIVGFEMIGMSIPWGVMSKDGLRGLEGIGPFITLIMMSFLIFRVVRVGGKGARWLFPQPEEPRRRRR